MPTGVYVRPSTEERFWSKVDRSGGPDSCWPWTGSIKPGRHGGYGMFRGGDGVTARSHRVAYEFQVGPIPAGLELDHLCRNRACQNARHLEPVTHHENVRRGDGGRNWREKTHCPRGHPYNETNTLALPTGRWCLSCRDDYNRQRRERRAA